MKKQHEEATGKVRAVLSPIDFKYSIEEEYHDGSWKPMEASRFGNAEDAKAWFERAKKAKRQAPALLGNWND